MPSGEERRFAVRSVDTVDGWRRRNTRAPFLRVVTHPRIFAKPSPLSDALAFTRQLGEQPNAVAIATGPGHWAIFRDLCTTSAARGNLVADAYLAAIALESGCEWITADRDFTRFRGLRTRSPLA